MFILQLNWFYAEEYLKITEHMWKINVSYSMSNGFLKYSVMVLVSTESHVLVRYLSKSSITGEN